MPKKRIFSLATLLLIASSSSYSASTTWTKEPESFMGIGFQDNVERALPECPKGYEIPKTMCQQKMGSGLYRISGLPKIGLVGGYGLTIFTKESRIDSFYLTTTPDDFGRLVQIFTERYGKPTSQKSEPVKTRSGAQFTNEAIGWTGKDVVILMQKYDGSIATSSATVQSKRLLSEKIKEADGEVKSAAGKL